MILMIFVKGGKKVGMFFVEKWIFLIVYRIKIVILMYIIIKRVDISLMF